MVLDIGRIRQASFLLLLILCALLLSGHLVYLFLKDAQRFPINTVKIVANYEHITRKQLAVILSEYAEDSFFTLSTSRLAESLKALGWSESVQVERIWPDSLKIVLVEKSPIAVWNNALLTADGKSFQVDKESIDSQLPKLTGPQSQQHDVLQSYQKLSKLLSIYGLQASALQLRDNQAWELTLTNGILLRLGKKDLEKRLIRFCKAYLAVFADKTEQLVSVDLRYARGMAVLWKQQTGR